MQEHLRIKRFIGNSDNAAKTQNLARRRNLRADRHC